MKTRIPALLIGSMFLINANSIDAQTAPKTPKRTGSAETRLVGVNLYDSGLQLVKMFGSPDEIQAISIGGAGGAAGGGASSGDGGGGGGRRGGASGGGRGGSGGGVSAGPPTEVNGPYVGDPFDLGNGTTYVRQAGPSAPSVGGNGGSGGGPGGGEDRSGGSTSNGDGSTGTQFTRWVYNRPNARYGFVLDKFNKVVQIEAIGVKDARVKTRRGATLGSSFADLIKKYSAPDNYEINGDTLVVKFLIKDRVAFRLSRIEAKKPQRVTGIVVSAGKG